MKNNNYEVSVFAEILLIGFAIATGISIKYVSSGLKTGLIVLLVFQLIAIFGVFIYLVMARGNDENDENGEN